MSTQEQRDRQARAQQRDYPEFSQEFLEHLEARYLPEPYMGGYTSAQEAAHIRRAGLLELIADLRLAYNQRIEDESEDAVIADGIDLSINLETS